ncbi:Radical SAM superfamily protein [Tistlia consotensis]|uniref:Radical SAM superfamily protein n=1 Tax=Tistlia consotensis USBA 355 TaxID=560819 RepID=A0A1Y6BTW9_9PROT|nr:radical SAM protein [Tistlia consotensis]SMF21138.1 Radical SAM superfamily protein [Tistlia consotensis USBA 355]SNR47166.1 Radical SAM superfamily protein [Tistlia consotensis]
MGTLARLTKAVSANLLPPELFDGRAEREAVKRLFSRYVDLVEIENHSYCNRTCWFCPNVFLDRRSANHLMSDALFERIVADLASIDYRQVLMWSRYHEPLAHDSLYPRLAKARAALPNAQIALTSNGDYLNPESIAALEAAGVDRLFLDLYLPDGREGDPEAMADGLRRFGKRTGLGLEEIGQRDYRVTGSVMKITMGVPNFSVETMWTRGGLMDIPKRRSYRRRAACFAPVRHVVVDWNGKGVLCCHVRSDAPQQAEAVIGDLSQPGYGLFDFYRDLAPARAGLLAPGPKGGVCETCDVGDDGPDRLGRVPWRSRALRALPGAVPLFERLVDRRRARYRYDPEG